MARFLRNPLLSGLSFLTFAATVLSQMNVFTEPNGKNGPVIWELGSNQVVSWNADVQVYNVSFWQINPASCNFNIFSTTHAESTTLNSVNWTVQMYDFDLSTSPQFLFWINYGATAASNWTSIPFNITSQTSSENHSNSASATSPSPSSPSPSSTSSTLPPSSSPSSSSSGTSTNADVGMGVGIGIGIGIPLLGLLSFIAFMLWRRQRLSEALPPPPESKQITRTPSSTQYHTQVDRAQLIPPASGLGSPGSEWSHELPVPRLSELESPLN